MYPSISLSLSVCLSVYLSIDRSIYLSLYLSISLSLYLSLYLSLSLYPSISISISISIYLSIYLSICLSLSLSLCLSVYLSARLKTKLFCETSSVFELDNIKNAIQRDFLSFCTWQHQKRNNSARLPHFSKLTTSKTKQFCETSFKNGKLSAELMASYQCVLRFLQSTCLKYCACHEKGMPGRTKCCTCHAKPSQQNWRSDAPPLTQSAPGPPNISDKHVSCSAPATENASLQILFACPTPAIVFGHATKSSHFAHFWQGAQSLAPATRNDIWTSKSGPKP